MPPFVSCRSCAVGPFHVVVPQPAMRPGYVGPGPGLATRSADTAASSDGACSGTAPTPVGDGRRRSAKSHGSSPPMVGTYAGCATAASATCPGGSASRSNAPGYRENDAIPVVQCAAVNIQRGERTDPPQSNPVGYTTVANGQSAGVAVWRSGPTTLGDTSPPAVAPDATPARARAETGTARRASRRRTTANVPPAPPRTRPQVRPAHPRRSDRLAFGPCR